VPLTPVVATPGISPASGTYNSAQTVTITDATPTTTVYYAASGALQTSGWVEYTGAIALPSAGRTTIQACAIERGYQQSNFASTTYYLNLAPTAAPVISPASGVYPGPQSVTISDSSAGGVISYSINGTSPAAASQPYTGPIPVSSSATVVATATAYGYAPSPAVSAQYLIGSSATSLIYSIAGNGSYGYSGDGGPAVAADLNYPFATAVDSAGNLYIADSSNNVVRKVAPGTGIITTFAGNGTVGYSGDNGPAASAQLFYPSGVAVDRAGNVYVADRANNVVREVAAATGTITTIAGTGTPGYAGDGGPAGAAELYYPTGLATDSLGNLYIADAGNSRIREVAAQTGVISTVAGSSTGGYSGDGGPATSAALLEPYGVAIDSGGNLYVADTFNHVIRKVNAATSLISTVAGNGHGSGTYGAGGYSGDGGPASGAELNTPYGVAVDGAGNLSIADNTNQVIRQVAADSGIISTVVGNGAQCTSPGGDGGPATSAALCYPQSVTVDSAGNLYIASGARIRMATAPGTPPSLTAAKPAFSVAAGTYAGPQTVTITDSTPGAAIYVTLDGSIPTTAGQGYKGPINVSGNVTIQAIAVGPGFLASPPVSASYIITSPPTAVINTVAGDGVFGFSGIGGPATSAQLGAIAGVALDGSGNLYFTDPSNHTVWQVAAQTGIASIVAGNGSSGYSGDGGPATAATLVGPDAVTVDSAGNLYIADQGSSVVRKVAASTGLITTYAGGGRSGDGGPAIDASLNAPGALALDGAGNLYIADPDNCRVRMVSANSGVITTVAGTGTCESSGDGGLATAADLIVPNAVALDSAGNLYIASANGGVRKVTAATGIITTVAGAGDGSGSSGDGGPAIQAQVTPNGLALDSAGNLYISDWPDAVRVVSATSGIITRFAGNGYPGYSGDGGSATVAELRNPAGIAFDASGNLYIADSGNYRVREVSSPRAPAAIPVFSPAAGSYTGAQMVALTDGTKDAAIYYTTDGSTPTTFSNVYSGPIPIAATTTIQALAVAAGYPQSAVASAVYTIHVPPAPAVTVTASSTSITTAQALTVMVTVSGGSGSPTATGSASLTSGSYSTQQNLANGAATFSLAAGVLPVGSDILTAVYAPDASSAAQYKSATDYATVTVTQASNTDTATVTLTPSATTVTNEQPVNVAVSVAGATGQPTPTGTVTFVGGSYSAQQPLTGGAANFSIPASDLSASTNTLTANYSGDGTYAAARGSVTVTVAPVVVAASNPSPVAPGSSAMATVTFSAGSNYSGTLNLACALIASPAGAQSVPTCNLDPASVTLAAGAQATTVLTAKTTAASSSSALYRPEQDLWQRWGGGGVIALALMFGVPGLRGRRLALLIGLCAVIVAGVIGCGGGGAPSSNVQPETPATTAGSYTFSVTATSNAKTIASTHVTVTVQ
jgi:sugar lactone lactonase YvrE